MQLAKLDPPTILLGLAVFNVLALAWIGLMLRQRPAGPPEAEGDSPQSAATIERKPRAASTHATPPGTPRAHGSRPETAHPAADLLAELIRKVEEKERQQSAASLPAGAAGSCRAGQRVAAGAASWSAAARPRTAAGVQSTR